MPANARSLQLTDIYRDRLLTLRARAGQLATSSWQATVSIDDLDGTHPAWVNTTAPTLAILQAAGVRLTAAYLTAFLRSERGTTDDIAAIDESRYAGIARTGKPLAGALIPTLITVKKAIAAGADPAAAFDTGRAQAERLAVTETMDTPRAALADTIRADARIVGWRRVTGGGCGACLAAATRTYLDHEPLRVHDNCRCGAEPVVRDVAETVHRPDGRALWERMPATAQDEMLGPEKAELVRSGAVGLDALVAVSPMVAIGDQITEASLEAVQAQAA